MGKLPMSRCAILLSLTFCLIGQLFPAWEAVGQDDEPTASAFQHDQVDVAVDKAIAFLLTQQRDDGAILDKSHDTTMTALSIMAMASVGVQPVETGPEGQVMARALQFVLREDRAEKNGYFGNRDGSRMYGHGIITLMLTEMLGMGTTADEDRLIHERCQAAINVILASQRIPKPTHYRGGWRYTPESRDADLSVSVWQLMALRSAKNDGLQVQRAQLKMPPSILSAPTRALSIATDFRIRRPVVSVMNRIGINRRLR